MEKSNNKNKQEKYGYEQSEVGGRKFYDNRQGEQNSNFNVKD
jgi:hypothetical protein